MTLDHSFLIQGYLDETLSSEEHAALSTWIRENPSHARRFAEELFLHDALRNELAAIRVMQASAAEPSATAPSRQCSWKSFLPGFSQRSFLRVAVLTALSVLLVVGAVLFDRQNHTASASVTEAFRIMSGSASLSDRTYEIHVEERTVPRRPERRRDDGDRRPPKPSIDNALLHVRGNNQFVLIRQMGRDGAGNNLSFVTGSDGRDSWAVRPDGPVRVSSDLNRFNRDVPGHEHSMPLINVHEGLSHLTEAYDVQVLPSEQSDEPESENSGDNNVTTRLLVAVRKRGFRGPRRVEIAYEEQTGQIRQMRFVEMPYGPERLTVRLTLASDTPLSESYFSHESHHGPVRAVERED